MILTQARFSVLAEISKDIAQVFFASILIDPLVSRSTTWFLVIPGLILSISFWTVSILLTDK